MVNIVIISLLLFGPVINQSQSLPFSCLFQCTKPFGTVIGIFEGVEAYSNCNSNCISSSSYFLHLNTNHNGNTQQVFSGMKWQCVEYARRFLIHKYKVSIEDVDSAYQIFDKTHVIGINKHKYDFVSYTNSNSNPPQIYDLLIYDRANGFPYGHVAVISKVNLSEGYIEVCEQNYDVWKDPNQYSRRLQLLFNNGKYIVTNDVYIPFHYDKSLLIKGISRPNNILGWKRVKLS